MANDSEWDSFPDAGENSTNEWESFSDADEFNQYPNAEEPQTNSSLYDNPLLAAMAGVKYAFDKPVHGLAQPLLESGYLGQGVSDWSKNWAKQTNDIYNRSKEASPWATGIGEYGYKLARDVPLYAQGGKALTGLTSKLSPGVMKWLLNRGLISKMLSGGITGGLEGAADYVNEGESRLENATNKAVGGAIGAGVLHGGGKALGALGKNVGGYLKNIPKAFPKGGAKELADKITKVDRDAASNAASEVYEQVIGAADKAKAKVDLSKIKSKGLLGAMNTAEGETLKKALPKVKESKIVLPNGDKLKSVTPGDTSFRNVHNIKKDFDKAITRLAKLPQTTKVSNKLNKLEKGRIKIQNAMSKALKDAGLLAEHNAFKEVNKTYADKVLKYNHPLILKYLGEEGGKKSIGIPTLTAKDFLKKAHGDSTFRAHFGTKYPEIEVNQLLPKYLKAGAGAVGVGGLGGISYQLFKDK